MHVFRRLLQINLALWGYFAWWLLARSGVLRPGTSPPVRLSQVLEGLGTTFVKLGQGLGPAGHQVPGAAQRTRDVIGCQPHHGLHHLRC